MSGEPEEIKPEPMESEAVNGASSSETTLSGSRSTSLPDDDNTDSVSAMVYREQLTGRRSELVQLSEGKHPQYHKSLSGLEGELEAEVGEAELAYELEMERIEEDKAAETRRWEEELAERKAEIADSLISDLEERRKAIEAEHSTLELGSDALEAKTASTRRLRRRPNEPPPREERRWQRRPPHVSLLLPEHQIAHDQACVAGRSPPREEEVEMPETTSGPTRASLCPGDPGAILENNRLHYENKHYLRGQAVYVETSDLPKVPAVIQHIGDFDILFKPPGDGKRFVINLWELRDGRAIIRKRTA